METEKKDFVNFNGIDKKFVNERTVKGDDGVEKKLYNIGVFVKSDLSRNGIANISFTEKQYNAFVHESKSDASKVNVGVPEGNVRISVCTFNDKDDKSKNKYENKEIAAKDLLSSHIERMKDLKEKNASKDDGPER